MSGPAYLHPDDVLEAAVDDDPTLAAMFAAARHYDVEHPAEVTP